MWPALRRSASHGGKFDLVCHQCYTVAGRRYYAIMARAKKRSGIPLDLIKSRGSSPPVPRPTPMKGVQEAASIKDNLANQWKTVKKHPKHLKVSSPTAPASNYFEDQHRSRRSAGMPASSNRRSDERAAWRSSQEDDDFELEWDSIQSDSAFQKASSTQRTTSLLQRHLPREPAGLNERLVKTRTGSIVQPANPRFMKVAVIGAANAGKSTLVNQCVGEEISVVSSKSHTTRERILAVLTENDYQVAFLDTPGVIPDNNHAKMNRTLASSSWRSLDEADHAIIMVDAEMALSPRGYETEKFILGRLAPLRVPATLVFNKMDLIDYKKKLLRDVTLRYRIAYPFIKQAVYISALENVEMDKLKNILFRTAPERPWEYPGEQTQEMPDLKRVEELIRVEFFKRLHQYIPYMLKQENMGWTELRNGTLRIEQNVYVERDSQHKIVVGANGKVVNEVIECARANISRAFRRPIQLFIQVKTKKN